MKYDIMDFSTVNGKKFTSNPFVVKDLNGSDGAGVVCLVCDGNEKQCVFAKCAVVYDAKTKPNTALVESESPLRNGQKQCKSR